MRAWHAGRNTEGFRVATPGSIFLVAPKQRRTATKTETPVAATNIFDKMGEFSGFFPAIRGTF